jgi:hypothetical protein
MLTYLDSDLMFFHDPEPLFDELGTESILIVPHRNPARLQWWDNWGVYNAGFVTFRRDESGMSALHWWRERCLEWCFARLEAGKSGDQTYLDDWPTRFPGTHVLEHVGGGLGPWNITESSVDGPEGAVKVDGLPLIFFHFATLRLYRDRTWLRRVGLLPRAYHFTLAPIPLVWTIDRSYAAIRRDAQELVWNPYLSRISAAHMEIHRTEPGTENELAHLKLGDIFVRSAPRVLVRWARRLRAALE